MDYGLQLYSVRDQMKANMEETLSAVAALGYKAVEFAGFFGQDAETVAAWLKKYGLRVSGTHTGAGELTPDKLEETIAYHKAIGNKNIIIPGHDTSTKEKLDAFIDLVNDVQPKLAAAGINLGYHNHSHEFLLRADGIRVHDELWNRTDLFFEIDTYCAYVAGRDPVAMQKEKAARVPVIHLKDGDLCHVGKSLGEGFAPVAAVRETAKALGMYMVVESEGQQPDGLSEVGRCIRYLAELEK